MKNFVMSLAMIFALGACNDNKSADDSQNNTSTAPPTQDSSAHSRDSSSPSIENSGANNPNTVNSVGNQGTGAGSQATTQDSVVHPNGVTDGSAVSRDTMAMSKGQKK